MSQETIEATVQAWQAAPEKAKSRPRVNARTSQAQAAIEAGPFNWTADLPQPLGGANSAPSPTALLLSALAGCAEVFIRETLAPQLGVRVEHIEATAQCDADARGLLGMEGAIPDLQNLQLKVEIRSPDGEEAVQRLASVWLQRCPIYLALRKPMDVSTSFVAAG